MNTIKITDAATIQGTNTLLSKLEPKRKIIIPMDANLIDMIIRYIPCYFKLSKKYLYDRFNGDRKMNLIEMHFYFQSFSRTKIAEFSWDYYTESGDFMEEKLGFYIRDCLTALCYIFPELCNMVDSIFSEFHNVRSPDYMFALISYAVCKLLTPTMIYDRIESIKSLGGAVSTTRIIMPMIYLMKLGGMGNTIYKFTKLLLGESATIRKTRQDVVCTYEEISLEDTCLINGMLGNMNDLIGDLRGEMDMARSHFSIFNYMCFNLSKVTFKTCSVQFIKYLVLCSSKVRDDEEAMQNYRRYADEESNIFHDEEFQKTLAQLIKGCRIIKM